MKEESEKAGLKLNIQKTKIMASDPMCSYIGFLYIYRNPKYICFYTEHNFIAVK